MKVRHIRRHEVDRRNGESVPSIVLGGESTSLSTNFVPRDDKLLESSRESIASNTAARYLGFASHEALHSCHRTVLRATSPPCRRGYLGPSAHGPSPRTTCHEPFRQFQRRLVPREREVVSIHHQIDVLSSVVQRHWCRHFSPQTDSLQLVRAMRLPRRRRWSEPVQPTPELAYPVLRCTHFTGPLYELIFCTLVIHFLTSIRRILRFLPLVRYVRSGQSVQPDVITSVQPFYVRLKGPAEVHADAVMTQ